MCILKLGSSLSKRPIQLGALIVAVLQTSCGPGYQAPPVTPQLVKVAKAPVTELERGYVIHQAKCAKCHPFENPAEYDVDELKHEIMPEMARKSKLDTVDQKAVLAYLLAARNLPPVPPS
jgi:hypothetical protein